MKATGIVRRIDDLGRIVIPKEIRRTLRIREGDPLEIYTGSDGQVIFKKYSPVGEINTFVSEYAEVLSSMSDMPTLISDRDHIVAAAGVAKKEYMDRRITPELEDLMDLKQGFSWSNDNSQTLHPVEGIQRNASIMYPIIASDEVTGAVIMLENETGGKPSEADDKLVQTAAAFLGKQME